MGPNPIHPSKKNRAGHRGKKDHVKTEGEGSHLRATDRGLKRNNLGEILILVSSLYNCEKINVSCLSPPGFNYL